MGEERHAAIEDTAGKLTDGKELHSEGKFDKGRGPVHKVAGDLKDAVKATNK